MSSRDIANLKQGLVAAWIPSLGSTGYRLVDRVGSNHGTVVNADASTFWKGDAGYSINLDGSNDYIDIADFFDFTSGSMTIAAWIRRSETTTAERSIVTKFDRSGGADTEDGYGFRVYENKLQYFAVLNAATHTFSSSSADMNTTDWLHCAVSVQSGVGSAAKLYKNGSEIAATWTALNGNVTLDNNAYNLRVGNYKYSGANYGHFAGQLDDIRIYNRALSTTEVSLLSKERGIGFKTSSRTSSHFAKRYSYKPPKDKTYAAITRSQSDYDSLREGLVLAICPSITQGSGYRAPDLSGRGNHGTVTNADLSTFWKADGGVSANFDGSNDVISCPFTSFPNAFPFTLSCFFKVADTTTTRYLLSISDTASNDAYFSLNSGSNGFVSAAQGDLTGTVLSESINSYTTGWNHICAIFKSATSRQVFLNGVAGTENTTSRATNFALLDSVNLSALRRSADVFSATQLDDVRIYRRSLTPPEIRLLASRRGIGLQPTPRHTDYIETREKTYSVIVKSQSEHDSLREGLVGAWCPSVTGATGFTVPDLSRYGNAGRLTNMTSEDWVSSNGLALDFDGSDDYLRITGDFNYLRNINKTITAWVKTSTPGNSYRTVFSRDLTFAMTIKDSVLITYDWAAGSDRSSGVNVANGQWRHLAVAIRSGVTNGSAFYVDGVQVGSAFTYSDQAGNTGANVATSAMTGLNANGVAQNEYVNGQLDDLRLYNRFLSGPEIRLLASKRGIGLAPRPRHYTYYQFPSASRRRKLITGMP